MCGASAVSWPRCFTVSTAKIILQASHSSPVILAILYRLIANMRTLPTFKQISWLRFCPPKNASLKRTRALFATQMQSITSKSLKIRFLNLISSMISSQVPIQSSSSYLTECLNSTRISEWRLRMPLTARCSIRFEFLTLSDPVRFVSLRRWTVSKTSATKSGKGRTNSKSSITSKCLRRK